MATYTLAPYELLALRSPIERLLSRGCPVAVIWRVASFVVATFDAVACGRAWSHVGIKGGEIVPPAVAYCDASASVALKINRFRVVAASFHAAPHAAFWRHAQTVRSLNGLHDFAMDAAAAFCQAMAETRRHRDLMGSAFAVTQPCRLAALLRGRHNDESSESTSSKILGDWWHIGDYTPETASI